LTQKSSEKVERIATEVASVDTRVTGTRVVGVESLEETERCMKENYALFCFHVQGKPEIFCSSVEVEKTFSLGSA
jgi:hypothetical protein